MVGIFLPDWHRNEPRRMDFTGFVLAGTAFAGWVFGISVVTLPALPMSFGIAALIGGTVAALIYLWHYRRTEYPLLDLRLFRLPIFRSTMIGGTFFRLGTGAMPFLFPLMLQLAFGLNAFQTGTITFASAVGAFVAKFAAEGVLQRIGFRTAMIVTTAGTILGVVGMGLYTPETPVWLMLILLALTGFVQSIFWTATNAFVFADVEDKDAGQANVISQVGVQLSLAFGVALGGGALELFRISHGAADPSLTDFHLSFYIIAAVGIVSTLVFARLPKNAGANLSGHGGGGGGH
jgi:MFS family permease